MRLDSTPRMPAGHRRDRCTACRSASRSCSTSPAATSPTARTSATAPWPPPTRRSCGGCVTPARWWWTTRPPTSSAGASPPSTPPWLDAEPAAPRGCPAGRAAGRPRRSPPASCRSPSAATRADRSGSRPRSAGSSGSRRRTAGSAGPDGVALAPSFDTPGFLARSAALLAAALAAAAGPDPDDPATVADTTARRPRWSLRPGDANVRTRRQPHHPGPVGAAAGRAGRHDRHARLTRVAPTRRRCPRRAGLVRHVRADPDDRSAAGPPNGARHVPARADDYGPDVRRRLELAEQVTDSEHRTARADAAAATASILRTLQGVDVIVSPGRVGRTEHRRRPRPRPGRGVRARAHATR